MTNYRPRTKPFGHQAKATLAAARARNFAIFFEPRLGKTKAALDYVGILALKGELQRVLILAPRIALDVWESELHKHYTYSYHAETFTEEWSVTSRGGITTQFFLAGREETFRRERDSKGALKPGVKQQTLEKWRPDAVIIDESHEYKRPGGRGAQDCWRMVRRLRSGGMGARVGGEGGGNPKPYVLLLTGTPSAKGWRDIFAQFRIMDERILGTSASDFDEEHCVYGQGSRKYTIIKYRNLPALQSTVARHSISCTAEQAGLAGKISFQILSYDLPQRVRSAYEDLAENFVAEIDGQVITAANPGVKRLRLQQLTSGFTVEQRIHNEEINTAGAYLDLLYEQGERAIVYGRFTAEIDELGSRARKSGFETTIIDGRTRASDRAAAIARFQGRDGGRPRALVFQYQAGSRSIELSAGAEVLFATLPDGWVDFWQCLNRVRGPNQKRPVRITALCARGTVDRSVLYGLRAKEDIHRALMKNPTSFLRGEYRG